MTQSLIFDDMLVELVLYVGRMTAWLDLRICWGPMNALMPEALRGNRV